MYAIAVRVALPNILESSSRTAKHRYFVVKCGYFNDLK